MVWQVTPPFSTAGINPTAETVSQRTRTKWCRRPHHSHSSWCKHSQHGMGIRFSTVIFFPDLNHLPPEIKCNHSQFFNWIFRVMAFIMPIVYCDVYVKEDVDNCKEKYAFLSLTSPFSLLGSATLQQLVMSYWMWHWSPFTLSWVISRKFS